MGPSIPLPAWQYVQPAWRNGSRLNIMAVALYAAELFGAVGKVVHSFADMSVDYNFGYHVSELAVELFSVDIPGTRKLAKDVVFTTPANPFESVLAYHGLWLCTTRAPRKYTATNGIEHIDFEWVRFATSDANLMAAYSIDPTMHRWGSAFDTGIGKGDRAALVNPAFAPIWAGTKMQLLNERAQVMALSQGQVIEALLQPDAQASVLGALTAEMLAAPVRPILPAPNPSNEAA
jgi:hypothetical protein